MLGSKINSTGLEKLDLDLKFNKLKNHIRNRKNLRISENLHYQDLEKMLIRI